MSVDLAQLAGFATVVEYLSVVCLWGAVLIRVPSAVRSPRQHPLWFAVACAAAAMTISLPPVISALEAVTGPTVLVALGRHLLGVLSAGAVLDFAGAAADRSRHRGLVYAGTALVMAVLTVLELSGDDSRLTLPILIASHLFANCVCVRMCWRYRRGSSGQLRTSLGLFGLGTMWAGLFWCGIGAQLAVGGAAWGAILPLLMAVHAFLRASALVVPVAVAGRRAAADIATIWKLWPLWHDLTDTVPNVLLARRRPRVLEILHPQGGWRLLAYRKVVEIRDAILALYDHNPVGTADLARQYLAGLGGEGRYSQAMVMACVVREARNAKLAGRPPARESESMADFSGSDLAADTSFLAEVARAYGSAPVRAFGGDRRARQAFEA